MAGEVFISYAREDKAFVRRLHAELKQRDRDAWVDWEDIPLTADWWAEIQRGIDAANVFVFVISPDSARSAVCFKEIEYAAQHNKRMVPIMHRPITDPVDEQRLHPSINAHNWIFITEDEQFEAAFDRLLEALDTDLAYVREHTALLVRAQAWVHRQREPGLLLRGNALRDAEVWLQQGQQKERNRPTELHVEYITRSRRAQNRRTQRNAAIGAVVAVILALAVTSLVLYVRAEEQRSIAEEQRAKAEQSEALAQAIGISAQAQLELFGQLPERGVLLALEALENYPYVYQAERALGTAVQSSRVRAILPQSPSATNAVAWSDDGGRFVTVGEDNTAQIWDAATGQPQITLIGHTRELINVDWSPNGALIATAGRDNAVRIWDAATGEPLRLFSGYPDWVLDVAWSPDGTRIATTSADGAVRVWELRTGDLLLDVLAQEQAYVNSVDWSPDGTWLVTAEQAGMVRVWDTASGAQAFSWTAHTGNVAEAVWSPGGTHIATGSWDETVRVWDVREALAVSDSVRQEAPAVNLEYTITDHINNVTGVAWSRDGSLLLTSSRDLTARVWDADNGALLYTLAGHTGWVNDAAWSPDGSYILTVSSDRRARLWAANSGGAELTFAGHTLRVTGVAWSPDQRRIATVGADRAVIIWNTERGYPLKKIDAHERVLNGVAWSPDGALIATAADDRTVRVWDAATGGLRYAFSRHRDAVNAVAWSPDGTRLASASDAGTVMLWDALTGNEFLALVGHRDRLTSVHWSPDGAWIASADEDGVVMVWDAATGRRLALIETGTDKVPAAVFSPVPGDLRLVVVNNDETARIWRLDPGAGGELLPVPLQALAGHTLPLTGAAWSYNGERVVTVSNDRTAIVWDAATGAPLLTLEGHGDDVLAVDWARDGTYIVTAGADKMAKMWRVFPTTGNLIEYAEACCAVRELTQAEREQFGLLQEE